MSNPYLGSIRMFCGNFAPVDWAMCAGQLVAISQNDALFNLIGTTYGGDGQTTFGLPNMQGRTPVHMGTGQGLSTRTLGDVGGSEQAVISLQGTARLSGPGTALVLRDNQIPTVSPFLAVNFIIANGGVFPSAN